MPTVAFPEAGSTAVGPAYVNGGSTDVHTPENAGSYWKTGAKLRPSIVSNFGTCTPAISQIVGKKSVLSMRSSFTGPRPSMGSTCTGSRPARVRW